MAAPVREALDSALRKRGLYDAAREVLRTYAQSALGVTPSISSHALPTDVFEALRTAGIVDRLLEAAKEEGLSLDAATFEMLCGGMGGTFDSSASPPGQPNENSPSQRSFPSTVRGVSSGAVSKEMQGEGAQELPPLDPNHRYLRLNLGRGRAFLSHLDASYSGMGLDEEEDGDEGEREDVEGGKLSDRDGGVNSLRVASTPTVPPPRRYYVIHLLLNGQRFRSLPVAASVEPDFAGDVFYVDVQPTDLYTSLAPLGALVAGDGCGGGVGYSTLSVICTLVTHRTPPATHTGDITPPLSDSIRCEVIGSASLDWRGVCGEESGCLTALLPILPPHSVPGLPTPSWDVSAAAGGNSQGPFNTGTLEGTTRSPGGDGGGLGNGGGVPVGLLPITIEILPPPLQGVSLLPRSEISRIASKATAASNDAFRSFLTYAKAWWGEYRAIHPSFKRRLVRIFGEGGEAGGRYVPLVTRVTTLSPSLESGVLSPAQASRFVSLLPHWNQETPSTVGPASQGAPAWRSLHSILSTRGGTAADHALLLTSIFLGMGLDAYVCIGTKLVGGHATSRGGGGGMDDLHASLASTALGGPVLEEEGVWVLTRYPIPPQQKQRQGGETARAEGASSGAVNESGSNFYVVFHDPLTGLKYLPKSFPEFNPVGPPVPLASPPFPFLRLACCFSNDRFYACTAGDDTVAYINSRVGWNFEDEVGRSEDSEGSGWKGMEPSLLHSLPHTPAPPLAPPTLDPRILGETLEVSLRGAWDAYRRAAGGCVERCALARAALASVAGRDELDPPMGSLIIQSSTLPPGSGTGKERRKIAPSSAHALPWSDKFSFLMTQALVAYEDDRLHGRRSSAGSGDGDAWQHSPMHDFAVAVKRAVPRGSAFRAFPINFNHVSPSRAWCTLLASPPAKEIIETFCHADPSLTAFSLRVHVSVYAEDTVSAWVMLGVTTMVPQRQRGGEPRGKVAADTE